MATTHPVPSPASSDNATVTVQDLLGGLVLHNAHATFSGAMSPLVITSMKKTFGEAPSKPAPVVADAQAAEQQKQLARGQAIKAAVLSAAISKQQVAAQASTGTKQDKNSIKVRFTPLLSKSTTTKAPAPCVLPSRAGVGLSTAPLFTRVAHILQILSGTPLGPPRHNLPYVRQKTCVPIVHSIMQ